MDEKSISFISQTDFYTIFAATFLKIILELCQQK
jgi:hypothetical protein